MSTTADAVWAVAEISRFNRGRKPKSLAIKYQRMSENAFAFFRGTDHLYAARWSELRPDDAGPDLLICGDLHLENFGAYRTDDNDFRYDINDFDEALVAPCSLDLVRCTASILLAADVWKVSAAEAAGIATDYLRSYRAALTESLANGKVGEAVVGQGHGTIWDMLDDMAVTSQAKLLDRHTSLKGGQREILRCADKHPEISDKHDKDVRHAIKQFAAALPNPESYRVLDVTGRIAGIGSLGIRRYMILVSGGGTSDTNRLLDLKEAVPTSMLRCASGPQPDFSGDEAMRVVLAQRKLQSKPAASLAALPVDSRPFRLRELIPDENRSKLDRFRRDTDQLRAAVCIAGKLTAWSQLRGCPWENQDAANRLAAWATASRLDSILACASRAADVTTRDFHGFCKAYEDGYFKDAADD